MNSFARTDTSLIGQWWWTVDRWILAALLTLAGLGVILSLAATPAVAERIGFDTYHFVWRQLAYLPIALALMVGISLASPREVRRIAAGALLLFFILTLATLTLGTEVKGASRWIRLAGLSLQPSEFLKPAFAVTAAWMFTERHRQGAIPGYMISIAMFAAIIVTLLLQPDVGMATVITLVWMVQFFLAGLPMILVVGLGGLVIAGGVGSYFAFDHVRSRIDRFLDPQSGDSYQVSRSLEAFTNGGLLGTGPGEGTVKGSLPDAHADFVFAVAAEEFGMLACLLILALFAFVVLRGFARMMRERDLFIIIATTGLLVQFGLQAIINMASTVHLIPTKGMTLPFLSYGGSSLLAIAFGMGMVLALTRHRPGDPPGDLP